MQAKQGFAGAVAALVSLFASPVLAATGSGAGDHDLFTLVLLLFGAAFTAVQIVPPLVGMFAGVSALISRTTGQSIG